MPRNKKVELFTRSGIISVLLSTILFLSLGSTVQAIDFEQYPAAADLLEEIVQEYDLDRDWVEKIIEEAVYRESIVKAITRPAESFPWYRYRPILVTNSRASTGVQFWQQNEAALKRAEEELGVDAAVIVAIIGVETRYGKITGSHRIIDSLLTLTLGFPRRSNFFKTEFIEFLQLVNEEGIDPLTAKGSYAGAMGIPQFISSSYRNYAIDFNGNGTRNLISETDDAIGSVANYLKRHGWESEKPIYGILQVEDQTVLEPLTTKGLKTDHSYAALLDIDVELVTSSEVPAEQKLGVIRLETQPDVFEYRAGYTNFYVITTYNRSTLYAMAVAELSDLISSMRQSQLN